MTRKTRILRSHVVGAPEMRHFPLAHILNSGLLERARQEATGFPRLCVTNQSGDVLYGIAPKDMNERGLSPFDLRVDVMRARAEGLERIRNSAPPPTSDQVAKMDAAAREWLAAKLARDKEAYKEAGRSLSGPSLSERGDRQKGWLETFKAFRIKIRIRSNSRR